MKNGINYSKDTKGTGFTFVNRQNIFGRNEINANNLGKAREDMRITEPLLLFFTIMV